MDSEHGRHTLFVLVQSAIAVFFVLCSAAVAQQPSIRPYESEEDLWEALNDGEITFEEFVELLDLARAGNDSLIVPRSDWEMLPGSETGYLLPPDSSQTITIPVSESRVSRVNLPWLTAARVGYNTNLRGADGSDGYTVLRFQSGRWRANFDFEHDRQDHGMWRRRSIAWQPRRLTFILGNFEPRWGRGLVVGRRTRLVTNTEVSGDGPVTLGRFDGLYFSTDPKRLISTEIFLSGIYSDELRESAIGAQIVVRQKSWTFGLASVGGNVSRPDPGLHDYADDSVYVETDYSAHLRFSKSKREVLAEIALNSDGATAKAIELAFPLTRGRFHARAWSYGTGFVGLWGGGPGHSDTREVFLDSLYHTFNSRTSGERGFDFTTKIAATPTVNLRWDWMSHREEPGAKLEHSGIFRVELKQRVIRSTPFVRAQIDEDETESYSIGNYIWVGPREREFSVRAEFGTHYDKEAQFVRAGVGAKLQINRVVRLAPAIRWTDPNFNESLDGYWYFYFTETIVPVEGVRVEIALAWKHHETTNRDDLIELRVRGFVR